MGQYTRHWNRYRRDRNRGLLYLGLLVVAGAVLIGVVEFLVGHYAFVAVPMLIGLLFLWLVGLVVLSVRQWRVVCPRCGERYWRGRHHACPDCGLGYLQEDFDPAQRVT